MPVHDISPITQADLNARGILDRLCPTLRHIEPVDASRLGDTIELEYRVFTKDSKYLASFCYELTELNHLNWELEL